MRDAVARAHIGDGDRRRAAHGRRDGDRTGGAIVRDGDRGAGKRGERRVGSGHQVSRGVDTLDRVAEQDRGQLRQFECHRGGDALGGKEGGEGGVDWREDGEARRRRSERGEHISALRRRRGGDEGVQVVVAGDDREVSVDVDDGVDGVSDAVGRTDIGGLDTIEHSLAATDAEWPAFEAALRSAGWPLPAVSLEGEACRRVVLGEAEALEAEAEAEAWRGRRTTTDRTAPAAAAMMGRGGRG